MSNDLDEEVEAARIGAGSFPRAIPEDNVEYFIYSLGDFVSDTERRDKLRQVQASGTALLKKHLKDYIWEQDSFQLQLKKLDGTSYLSGRSSYGDSVEDEWIIVWLLIELSTQFDDIWIRVADTDGEFLLIEAANALPKWLNPEIADNRVWINQGHLRIIPRSTQQPGSLKLDQALKLLTTERDALHTDPEIEKEAFYRLEKYPGGIADTLHYALIKIPRKVAFLLQKQATYITAAIEAFYLRDPISLKPLQKKDAVGLTFPPVDLVSFRTKFTKIGFAKVRSQEFSYPPSWTTAGQEQPRGSKASFQAEMGMKVTCGFEMLLSDPHSKDKKVTREIKLFLDDLAAGEDQLPSNEEVEALGTTEDDDSWLNIDYQDFEKELAGKGNTGTNSKGFGSTDTQDKLKKMVSRFEDLLAEDNSALDLDDMDEDNDSEIEDSESDALSVNSAEEDFNEMMREILGMDKATMNEVLGRTTDGTKQKSKGKGKEKTPMMREERSDIEEDEEDEEIRKLSEAMEAELRASGALELNHSSIKKESKVIKSKDAVKTNEELESSDEEYLDEDYNLAKNMLESFKSQAGSSGPAGNLMGMLGVQMPRDEHDLD